MRWSVPDCAGLCFCAQHYVWMSVPKACGVTHSGFSMLAGGFASVFPSVRSSVLTSCRDPKTTSVSLFFLSCICFRLHSARLAISHFRCFSYSSPQPHAGYQKARRSLSRSWPISIYPTPSRLTKPCPPTWWTAKAIRPAD